MTLQVPANTHNGLKGHKDKAPPGDWKSSREHGMERPRRKQEMRPENHNGLEARQMTQDLADHCDDCGLFSEGNGKVVSRGVTLSDLCYNGISQPLCWVSTDGAREVQLGVCHSNARWWQLGPMWQHRNARSRCMLGKSLDTAMATIILFCHLTVSYDTAKSPRKNILLKRPGLVRWASCTLK